MSGMAEFGPEMADLGLEGGGQMHKQIIEQNIVLMFYRTSSPATVQK